MVLIDAHAIYQKGFNKEATFYDERLSDADNDKKQAKNNCNIFGELHD